jgi:hypothetical protein
MGITIEQLQIAYKNPCRFATTGAINLSNHGLNPVDGASSLNANDRILVKNQVASSENGIYVPGGPSWSRSKDFDEVENDSIVGQLTTRIQEGTYAGKEFKLDVTGSITLGTTLLTFALTTSGSLSTIEDLTPDGNFIVGGPGQFVLGYTGDCVFLHYKES